MDFDYLTCFYHYRFRHILRIPPLTHHSNCGHHNMDWRCISATHIGAMHIGNISPTYPQHSISHGNIGQHSIVSATNIQPGNIQSDFGNIQSGNIARGLCFYYVKCVFHLPFCQMELKHQTFLTTIVIVEVLQSTLLDSTL